MNKLVKIITLITLILVTHSCSYKPIFSKKSYDFKIVQTNFSGDKKINSIIKRKLKFIKSENTKIDKLYFLNINTAQNRKVISKDSAGDPSKFEISIETDFEISDNKKLLLSRNIKQKNIYNNESDKFKLQESEKIIIENLSEKISDSIISSIINLNDN